MVSQDYRPAPTPATPRPFPPLSPPPCSLPCHPRPLPPLPSPPSAAIPGPRPLPSHPRLHLFLPSPHRPLPAPSVPTRSLPCHPTPLLSQPSPQPWLLSLALSCHPAPLPPLPRPPQCMHAAENASTTRRGGGGGEGGDSPMNRWITFVNMKNRDSFSLAMQQRRFAKVITFRQMKRNDGHGEGYAGEYAMTGLCRGAFT